MRLYFNKFTRATRPRWLIEEAGLPCEIVNVDLVAGDHKKPEYLAIHPHGKLPALVLDDGTAVIESAAITMFLADLAPGLAPAPGSAERARYYQWIVYAVVTMEPAVAKAFYEGRKPAPDAAVQAEALADFGAAAKVVTAALEGRDWLLGEFSAADIMMGSLLAWARSVKLLEGWPALQAYVARCMARPAFSRART